MTDVKINISPLAAEFYQKPYNATRRAKLTTFDGCFSTYDAYISMPYDDKMSLIKKLERACLNATVFKSNEENIPPQWENELFQEIYHSICCKISSDIDPNGLVKNTKLATDIIAGNLNIAILPKMSSQDLYPDKYVEINEKIARSKNATQTIKTSSMYKCRRCHKSECTIENRYNRSLDEGTGLTITCMACGLEYNG
jgi:DNA-directed RNA polymerase subunit M/transcription elongation factor TFIIS